MSSSYHVKTEELYQAVENTRMTMFVQGETGDSIRS